MSKLGRGVFLLPLLLLLVACGPSANGGDDAPDGSATCSDGAHQCRGQEYYRCSGGTWSVDQRCPNTLSCSDTLGCVACPPGGTGCDGDKIVSCDSAGNPGAAISDCSPSTCVGGACAPPCSPEALARSNMGCVYFAADLPQINGDGLGGPIAAEQQFAVSVSNPWPVPVDVVVDKNDAVVGAPPVVSQVAHVTVAPGSLQVIPLPAREVDGFVRGGGNNRSMITAQAYRITTSRPTSAYQFNPINNPGVYSNDASLLIPVNALDLSYVELGWPGATITVPVFGTIDKNAYMTIVSTRANTHVRVTPSAAVGAGDNVPAVAKGTPYVVTLGEFETLNLEGGDAVAFGGAIDFTGSRIEADGPIAVFSGTECASINRPNPGSDTCCCDHLEEQLFPRSSLGLDYIAMRSPPRDPSSPEPDYFRILALSDGTDVTTSLPPPDDHFTLMTGEMHQVLTDTDFTVHATHAVMIGQYLLSQSETMASIGDPSFILIPPITQYRGHYLFLVPSGYTANNVVLSLPAGTTANLDGQPAQGCVRTPVGTIAGRTFETLRCPVMVGAHTIDATVPVGITVHGWGPGPVSYGYPGGMDFAPVNQDCTSGSCPSGEFCAGGVCVPRIQ